MQVHFLFTYETWNTFLCCVSVHFAAVIGAQVDMFQHLELIQERQNEELENGQDNFKQNRCVQRITVSM